MRESVEEKLSLRTTDDSLTALARSSIETQAGACVHLLLVVVVIMGDKRVWVCVFARSRLRDRYR